MLNRLRLHCALALLTLSIWLATAAGFANPETAEEKKEEKADIRYVAIGDSYTIGEGAEPREAWPVLLTKHLQANGIDIDLVANPSRTGWTTLNAIDRELPVFVQEKPTFATLMIGVNDWVQGV